MTPASDLPCNTQPASPVPATQQAKETEDPLLELLASDLCQERELLPVLLRRISRLRQMLAYSHEALVRSRRELALSNRAESCDSLTGLPNRRGFERPVLRVLEQHVGAPQKLALLFVDLDGFKAINDRLGHAAGDDLLRIVAARLSSGIRRGDLVCRHGGDEFVCILPNLESEERAVTLATELLRAITQPCELQGEEVRVTASIGVAMFPRGGQSLHQLLQRADAAMYAAKRLRCGLVLAREHGRQN